MKDSIEIPMSVVRRRIRPNAKILYGLLRKNPNLTIADVQNILGLSYFGAYSIMRTLKEENLIEEKKVVK